MAKGAYKSSMAFLRLGGVTDAPGDLFELPGYIASRSHIKGAQGVSRTLTIIGKSTENLMDFSDLVDNASGLYGAVSTYHSDIKNLNLLIPAINTTHSTIGTIGNFREMLDR
jgi:hypothetical protein